jgi:hypothetical protein
MRCFAASLLALVVVFAVFRVSIGVGYRVLLVFSMPATNSSTTALREGGCGDVITSAEVDGKDYGFTLND